MHRFWLLVAVLLAGTAVFEVRSASAQSLLGIWTISNNAINACPGKLQINNGDERSGHYDGVASFQCDSQSVTELFSISVSNGKIIMEGHNPSGPWCADDYTLRLNGAGAMEGDSRDGCGTEGTVSMAKTR